MKSTRNYVLSILLAFMLVFGFTSCSTTSSDSSGTPTNLEENLVVPIVTNEDQDQSVYALQALSSANVLASYTSATMTQPLLAETDSNSVLRLAESTSDEVTDSDLETINHYISVMEQLLNDQPIQMQVVASDMDGYQYKMIVTATDLEGNQLEYVLYYNEIVNVDEDTTEQDQTNNDVVEDETDNDAVEEEQDDHDGLEQEREHHDAIEQEENENEEGQEIESRFEGIMVIGDVQYTVIGAKEIDGDKEELKFTSYLDENNWVRVKQEKKVEDNEIKSEYKYTVCQNGMISENVKFELKQEDNHTKIEFNYSKDGQENKYEFKMQETEEGRIIKIEAKNDLVNDEIIVKVVVDPTTGEETYEYRFASNDREYHHERRNHFEDEDSNQNSDDEDESDLGFSSSSYSIGIRF